MGLREREVKQKEKLKRKPFIIGVLLIVSSVVGVIGPVEVSAEDSTKDKVILSTNIQKKYQENKLPYVEGEILVKFKGDTINDKTLKKHGVKLKELIGDNMAILEFPKYQKANNLVGTLSLEKDILEVQPNYIYYPTSISNDPRADEMWGLNNTGQKIWNSVGKLDVDINLPEAWKLIEDKILDEVVVAVIDTGVQTTHPDLKDNIWVNSIELNGKTGVDDDKNGYVDDINGYDFHNNDGSVFDSYYDDDHGTHVAGTIAGSINNGLGIVGIAENVKIMSLKFLGSDGGYSSDAIKAIEYAKKMGVKISNNSWGGRSYDTFLKKAIEESNMLFVAAAGNEALNNDTDPHYPSSYDSSNILSVSAVNNKGNLAYFSNYGKKSVDISAPGEDILSSVPGGYDYFNGTSMATPHVTGVSALAMGVTNDLSAEQLINLIKNTGKTVSGGSMTTSGKMIDAEKLIKNINPVSLELDELYDSAQYIKGKTAPYAKVTVKDVNSKLVSSLKADKLGNFSVKLNNLQKEGTKFYVSSVVGINVSEIIELIVVHDIIKPELKDTLEATNIKTTIEGIVSEEASIKILIYNKEFIGKTDSNGKFNISIGKQVAETKGTLIITDKAMPANVSEIEFTVKDGVIPIIKKVSLVYDTSNYIEGEISENSKVNIYTSMDSKTWTILNDVEILTDESNKFSYEITSHLIKGTKIKVVATDKDQNNSKDFITSIIPDKKAPILIEPKVLSLDDNGENTIKGKLDEKGTIEVKIAGNLIGRPQETMKDGSFEITLPKQEANIKVTFVFKDILGNKLEKNVTVQDGTKPVILSESVSKLYNTGKTIEGKVSEMSTVTATVNGKIIASSKTDSQGKFIITLKQRLSSGTLIELKATDSARPKALVSDVVNVSVETDTIIPELISITAVDNSSTISGKVSEEATVELKVGEKLLTRKPIATDIHGNFKITVAKQLANTKITVHIEDYGANKISQEVIVVDKTLPVVKKVDAFYHKTSSRISGIVSENSDILIYKVGANNKPEENSIASGKTDENGIFNIEIEEQSINSKLAVIAVDSAGNNSMLKIITVLKDSSAPTLKIDVIYTDSKEIIGELSEQGSVMVKIGLKEYSAITDHNNSFVIPLEDDYLSLGNRVTVIVEDVVGNKRTYNYTVRKALVTQK